MGGEGEGEAAGVWVGKRRTTVPVEAALSSLSGSTAEQDAGIVFRCTHASINLASNLFHFQGKGGDLGEGIRSDWRSLGHGRN